MKKTLLISLAGIGAGICMIVFGSTMMEHGSESDSDSAFFGGMLVRVLGIILVLGFLAWLLNVAIMKNDRRVLADLAKKDDQQLIDMFTKPKATPEALNLQRLAKVELERRNIHVEVPEDAQEKMASSKKAYAESSVIGSFAGLGAGLAAHFLAGGHLTFPIWIAAYVLVISGAKNKLVATIAFIPAAIFVTYWLHSIPVSN